MHRLFRSIPKPLHLAHVLESVFRSQAEELVFAIYEQPGQLDLPRTEFPWLLLLLRTEVPLSLAVFVIRDPIEQVGNVSLLSLSLQPVGSLLLVRFCHLHLPNGLTLSSQRLQPVLLVLERRRRHWLGTLLCSDIPRG